jgi:hypothetical protein
VKCFRTALTVIKNSSRYDHSLLEREEVPLDKAVGRGNVKQSGFVRFEPYYVHAVILSLFTFIVLL